MKGEKKKRNKKLVFDEGELIKESWMLAMVYKEGEG